MAYDRRKEPRKPRHGSEPGPAESHRDRAQHHFGKVWAGDVVNEAFNADETMRSMVWYDTPGIGFAGQGTAYIEQALRWAQAADPKAKLYNDYDTEALNAQRTQSTTWLRISACAECPSRATAFSRTSISSFDDPTALSSFAANLKRLSDLGMEIHITELDIALDDNSPPSLQAQGELYRRVTEICFENPSCRVLQTWGSTDKYSWIPGHSKGSRVGRYPSMLRIKRSPPPTQWCTRSKPGD